MLLRSNELNGNKEINILWEFPFGNAVYAIFQRSIMSSTHFSLWRVNNISESYSHYYKIAIFDNYSLIKLLENLTRKHYFTRNITFWLLKKYLLLNIHVERPVL